MAPVTIEGVRTRQGEIKTEIKGLNDEFAGEKLPLEQRERWNELNTELESLVELESELDARHRRLEELSGTEDRVESGAHFTVPAPSRTTGDDIYDLDTVRSISPARAESELRSRALRSIESTFVPPRLGMGEAEIKGHLESLVARFPNRGQEGIEADLTSVAERILTTGSPAYRRAWMKYALGRGYSMTSDEQRALALGTGSAGGFAVVYQLDPTMVPTSNYSVNPFRAIARVQQINGTNEWKALTSGAITAAYAPEATQASDNSPTLAQPDIIAEKAQAFVPYSIEVGEDWEGLQMAMAEDLSDAKDDLEATKFAVGAGHGSTEPKGVITAATNTTTAGGVAAFAIADLYKVLEALPPRYRPRAQWMANLFTIDKIRQFDTAGGSGVWIDAFGGGDGRGLIPAADSGAAGTLASPPNIPKLLGKNAWESTAMASALTTGSKIAIVGDWRYFVIVDRIGMNVEFIQNLVGANQRPTGQRGLYAYWRNSSDVLSAAAFQVLVTG